MQKKVKEVMNMLQDLSVGKLENEFYYLTPRDDDLVICFQNNQVLLCKGEDDQYLLPTVGAIASLSENWQHWFAEGFRYVFRIRETRFFLWLGDVRAEDCGVFSFEPIRLLRYKGVDDLCFAAWTAWHLYVWYRNNRFCGCCGSRTEHDSKERMLRCPDCGNMIFPRISPAIIVGVTDGDRLLMSKYAGRDYTHYALIAGYTEIGETLEQTVQREVMEEVGLKVKNIRYYKSQPWGIDGNILMGFYCDLDGDDTIHVDEKELALAEWHHRDAIPEKDDGMTITREMIRVFAEGKEPQ